MTTTHHYLIISSPSPEEGDGGWGQQTHPYPLPLFFTPTSWASSLESLQVALPLKGSPAPSHNLPSSVPLPRGERTGEGDNHTSLSYHLLPFPWRKGTGDGENKLILILSPLNVIPRGNAPSRNLPLSLKSPPP